MARITFRAFWSFISRRNGGAKSRPLFGSRPVPGWLARRLPLALVRLEDRALPSVSFAPDPANFGKSIVSFVDSPGTTTDNLVLRLSTVGSSAQLQYQWNSSSFSNDL